MPKGTPKAGYRRSKRRSRLTTEEIREELLYKTPEVITELEKLTKPFPCPHCGNVIKVIDKDVAMWVVDHAIGKSAQKHEVDVTTHVQLNADQLDNVLRNHLPQVVEMYRTEIAGLLGEGRGDE